MLIYQNEIASTFAAVHEIVLEIMERLAENERISKRFILFRINFMLREVLNNAVEHGNRFDESKRISVEIALEGSCLTTRVWDEGPGVRLPDADESGMDDVLRERKRGLALLRAYQFEIEAQRSQVCLRLDLDKATEEI